MKSLVSIILAGLFISCASSSGNVKPEDVAGTIDKICKLCPKTPCPSCPPTPEPIQVKIPVCSDQIKAGCWQGDQYLSCPVTPPPTCNCQPGYHCEGTTCIKDTPPPTTDTIKSACGVEMPDSASVFIKAKPYGQGIDTELNVLDWPELCIFIHGNPVNPNQCHLEGLDSKGYSRVACEMAIIEKESGGAGKCPVGIWQTVSHPGENKCLQDDPYETGGMSCDHFGNTVTRDDPNTPEFEGLPSECGRQRDETGKPKAGFFWIAHGDGEIKACLPNYESCSRSWVKVVH